MDSAPPGWLPERIRWWLAERFGERPECGSCGLRADCCVGGGYECLDCHTNHEKVVGPAFVRGLKPRDYFGGDNG